MVMLRLAILIHIAFRLFQDKKLILDLNQEKSTNLKADLPSLWEKNLLRTLFFCQMKTIAENSSAG